MPGFLYDQYYNMTSLGSSPSLVGPDLDVGDPLLDSLQVAVGDALTPDHSWRRDEGHAYLVAVPDTSHHDVEP